jgi:hypothetical protein
MKGFARSLVTRTWSASTIFCPLGGQFKPNYRIGSMLVSPTATTYSFDNTQTATRFACCHPWTRLMNEMPTATEPLRSRSFLAVLASVIGSSLHRCTSYYAPRSGSHGGLVDCEQRTRTLRPRSLVGPICAALSTAIHGAKIRSSPSSNTISCDGKRPPGGRILLINYNR